MLPSLALLLALSGGVDWRPNYGTAVEEARMQNRLILLHFFLPGRPVCKTMDDETFAAPEVVKAIAERYIPVRVDIEVEAKLFESTVGGRGGLATCVVDAGGDVISSRNGYAGPKDFVAFLNKAAAGDVGIREARKQLSSSPASPHRLTALGDAYWSSDSLRRAEDCYRRAIESATEGGEGAVRDVAAYCHERMARLRVMRGKNLEARKHLEEARRLDPKGLNAAPDRLLLTEGLVLAVERKHAEAARLLREAIEKHPASGELDHMLYALGFVLHQDNQDKPALAALESVAARFPASAWVVPAREQIEHIKNPQPDHVH